MKKTIILLSTILLFISSCTEKEENKSIDKEAHEENVKEFTSTLQKHLNAVSNKDPKTLRSTMSPDGKMQLILPSSEILYSVDSFMVFHESWFEDTTWTFETKIINTEVGEKLGIGITEVIYREPERNGAPYFNRMIVSYALEKKEDKWYIIKDHASSIEKTKPKKGLSWNQ